MDGALTHCFDGTPCYLKEPLSNRIQLAIEEEARVWGETQFYAPSPGQIWSHVAYCITQVVMRVLKEENIWP